MPRTRSLTWTELKIGIVSALLMPDAVILDPLLTLSLPQHITASTGMDALTHNVESYLSPEYHPLCDGIALEGVRIAARALPIASSARPRPSPVAWRCTSRCARAT